MLAEVIAARGLDAVAAVTVVDDVDVHHEDLVLGVLSLDLRGDVHLTDLAPDAAVGHLVEQDGVAHELLGDGGGALGSASGGRVHDHRTRDADGIYAAMFVKALVFGCDGALEHVFGDLVL